MPFLPKGIRLLSVGEVLSVVVLDAKTRVLRSGDDEKISALCAASR
jgi:hypothetical protein